MCSFAGTVECRHWFWGREGVGEAGRNCTSKWKKKYPSARIFNKVCCFDLQNYHGIFVWSLVWDQSPPKLSLIDIPSGQCRPGSAQNLISCYHYLFPQRDRRVRLNHAGVGLQLQASDSLFWPLSSVQKIPASLKVLFNRSLQRAIKGDAKLWYFMHILNPQENHTTFFFFSFFLFSRSESEVLSACLMCIVLR